MRHSRLAFVDVETTGVGARDQRIAEIGVVTLDAGGVEEWGTLLDPGRRIDDPGAAWGDQRCFAGHRDDRVDAPRFADIAVQLAARLEGQLLIAHNARFDYSFLKAEFERAGIAFRPQVLCTVMLSRKLFPWHDRHNLDALIERHGLEADVRHRALPDARLLYRFWQSLQRRISGDELDDAIDALLCEPLLPAHLNLELIDALPERPGIYVLEGDGDRPLRIGRAANLRREVKRYFRLDRNCCHADALSHRVRNIRWQPVAGPLDARLCEIALRKRWKAPGARPTGPVTIRIDPCGSPAAALVPLAEPLPADADLFGIYATERKAKNALARLADQQQVCHRLLGLPETPRHRCSECTPMDKPEAAQRRDRTRQLLRLLTGLAPARLQPWPYRGAIALREGRSVHVFDRWEHLGTVRTGSDVYSLLQTRRGGLDPEVFRLLQRTLPRLRAGAVRELPAEPERAANEA